MVRRRWLADFQRAKATARMTRIPTRPIQRVTSPPLRFEICAFGAPARASPKGARARPDPEHPAPAPAARVVSRIQSAKLESLARRAPKAPKRTRTLPVLPSDSAQVSRLDDQNRAVRASNSRPRQVNRLCTESRWNRERPMIPVHTAAMIAWVPEGQSGSPIANASNTLVTTDSRNPAAASFRSLPGARRPQGRRGENPNRSDRESECGREDRGTEARPCLREEMSRVTWRIRPDFPKAPIHAQPATRSSALATRARKPACLTRSAEMNVVDHRVLETLVAADHVVDRAPGSSCPLLPRPRAIEGAHCWPETRVRNQRERADSASDVSQNPRASIRGSRARKSACSAIRKSTACDRHCASWRTSASAKKNQVPAGSFDPCFRAWGLPSHPSGGSTPSMMRRRESSRARVARMAGVPSLERSSTTITSKSAYCWLNWSRTAASIARSSLRAGMTIETLGPASRACRPDRPAPDAVRTPRLIVRRIRRSAPHTAAASNRACITISKGEGGRSLRSAPGRPSSRQRSPRCPRIAGPRCRRGAKAFPRGQNGTSGACGRLSRRSFSQPWSPVDKKRSSDPIAAITPGRAASSRARFLANPSGSLRCPYRLSKSTRLVKITSAREPRKAWTVA